MTMALVSSAKSCRVVGVALLLVSLSRLNVAAPFGLCELGKPSCWYRDSTWRCWEVSQWSQPLDVDGDGVSEFDFAYRTGGWWCGWTNGPDYEGLDFRTWAVFPEAHVEVLYLLKRPLNPVLEAGFPILPDPGAVAPPRQPGAWSPPEIQPYLRAFGLGNTDPFAGCHPQDYTQNCSLLPFPSWVVATVSNPWISNFLFGIRVAHTDGWHLGWIELVWCPAMKTLSDGRTTEVDVGDYAVHPDPDTEIGAGEPPRPRLWYAVEGDRVRLWWSAAWAGYRLDRASALTDAAWEPVDGVVDRSVTLPKGVGARFFRLVQPPGP